MLLIESNKSTNKQNDEGTSKMKMKAEAEIKSTNS